MSNSGVVDEDIERPVQSTDERKEIIDRVGAADVAGLRQHGNMRCLRKSFRLELVQFNARLGQSALVAAGDDEIASFTGQPTGDGEADAAVGAGDEGEAAGKHGFARREFVGAEFTCRHTVFLSLFQLARAFESGVHNSAIGL